MLFPESVQISHELSMVSPELPGTRELAELAVSPELAELRNSKLSELPCRCEAVSGEIG